MSIDLVVTPNSIPAMSAAAIDKVRSFEARALTMPQVGLSTSHVLHGGMYARTILIPAGVIATGAFITVATIVIVQGEGVAYSGDDVVELSGYNVLSAVAGRKQAFFAHTDTYWTMVFPTDAKSVKEAEEEFTDEADMLMSRRITED